MDQNIADFAKEYLDDGFFFDLDDLPELRRLAQDAQGAESPKPMARSENREPDRKESARSYSRLIKHSYKIAIAACALVFLGWQWLSLRHASQEFNRKIELVNEIESKNFDDPVQFQNYLTEVSEIDSELRPYAARRAIALMNSIPPGNPIALSLINEWENDVRDYATSIGKFLWFRKQADAFAIAGDPKKELEASNEAIRYMYECSPDQWNGDFANIHTQRLRMTRDFETILVDTETIAKAPAYWMQHGFLHTLGRRVTAFIHFGRNKEADELAKQLVEQGVQSDLTIDEVITTNLIAADTSGRMGRPEDAEKYLEKAKSVQGQFVDDVVESKHYQIAIMSTESNLYPQDSRDGQEKIIETTNEIESLINELTIVDPSVQTLGLRVSMIRMQALISLGMIREALDLDEIIAPINQKNFSGNIEFDSMRTKLFVVSGNYQKAVDIGQQALEKLRDDGSPIARSQLSYVGFFVGYSKGELGEFEQAAHYFKEAANLAQSDPFRIECEFNLGICVRNLDGRRQEGQAIVQKAISESQDRAFVEQLSIENKLWISKKTIAFLPISDRVGQD